MSVKLLGLMSNEALRSNKLLVKYLFFYSATAPSGPGPPHYRNFTIKLKTHENWAELPCMNDQLDARTST